jgi:hypothetical protein
MGKSASFRRAAAWGRGIGVLLFTGVAWLGLTTCGGGGGTGPAPSLVLSTKSVAFSRGDQPPQYPAPQEVSVTATGPNPLTVAANIQYQTTGAGEWLTATWSSSTTPCTLTLGTNSDANTLKGLPDGTYSATVQVTAVGADPQVIAVTLTIPPMVGPVLIAESRELHQVKMVLSYAWPPSEYRLSTDAYLLERSTESGASGFSLRSTIGEPYDPWTSPYTAYDDLPSPGATYWWRVRVRNYYGETQYSNVVCVGSAPACLQ